MTTTTLSTEQSVELLKEAGALSTDWHSVLHGNYKFWNVPASFDRSQLSSDFSIWIINDNNSIVIRQWSKW